jgi:hypothetical protein
MKVMFKVKTYPECWRTAKTVLLPKTDMAEEDLNSPGIWRPISLTSIKYRTISNKNVKSTKWIIKIQRNMKNVKLKEKKTAI